MISRAWVATKAKAFGAAVARVGASALAWLLLLATGGVAAVVAGVYVLVGSGWALVACGAFLLLFSFVIFRGISRG